MPRYTASNTGNTVVEIFLNGDKLNNVVEVDDDLGFAIVRDKNAPFGKRLVTGDVVVTFGERHG